MTVVDNEKEMDQLRGVNMRDRVNDGKEQTSGYSCRRCWIEGWLVNTRSAKPFVDILLPSGEQ